MSTANHALAVLALLFAAVWAQAEGAPSSPTPAGTVLGFRASARYLTGSGTFVESPFSNLVSVTVLHVANTVVRPGLTLAAGEAGTVAHLPLTVTNLGNGRDKFDVFPSELPPGVTVTRLTGPVPLGHGETAAAIVSLTVSEGAPAGELELDFRAISRGSPLTASPSTVVLAVLPIPGPPEPPPAPVSPVKEVTLGGGEVCAIPPVLAALITVLWAVVERRSGARANSAEPLSRRR